MTNITWHASARKKQTQRVFERVSALLGEQTDPLNVFGDAPAVVKAGNAFSLQVYEYEKIWQLHRIGFVRLLLTS